MKKLYQDLLTNRKEVIIMAEIRKDDKGRILHPGESQRKDGRYCYQYQDHFGKRRAVYSWRLTIHDRIVPGTKKEPSLREKERQIQADLFDQIIPAGGNLSVVDLVKKYDSLTLDKLRQSTKASHQTVINLLEKEEFGKRRIDKVRISDAKEFLVKLQKVNHKGFTTIRTIRGVLRPAFQMAMDDDIIRKNPFGFQLADVIYNDSVRRESLTYVEERKFMNFVKNDPHFSKYYDGIFILLNTGLRISEFVGLTKADLDFKNKKIKVDHQLQRYAKVGYQIVDTKTDAGTREVPMIPEVEEAFKRVLANRPKLKVEPMIDGYSGFIWIDKDDNPMVANHWEKYFQHIVEKYNSIYKVQLPKITPHVLRHTFCSRMAAKGMNPKVLQNIMGHSDISVTLNTYTDLEFEDIAKDMEKVTKIDVKKDA